MSYFGFPTRKEQKEMWEDKLYVRSMIFILIFVIIVIIFEQFKKK
jgi:hypothetical protein